jgi:methionyl-tRNA formyltransferase
MKPLICVAGKNEIAVKGLELLENNYSSYDICCIPNATDDGTNSWQRSLVKRAKELNIPIVSLDDIYQYENLIFISMEFAELIKTSKFKSPNLYNIHFSKLPKYKGMYTSAHPILNGEEETGVTLHLIDDGIDTGNIIDQHSFEILNTDTARDLYLKYLENGYQLLKNNIDYIINGQLTSKPQESKGSSYYSMKSIDYSLISVDYIKTATEVHNQIRAFTFREYQMPTYHGWQIIKSTITPDRSLQRAGTLLKETEEYFLVSTIDYNVTLIKDYYSILWESCRTGIQKDVINCIRFIEDINLRNKNGWNAVIIAVYNGHYDLLRMLIEQGANVDSTNYKGTTVLMYALSYFEKTQDDSIIKILLQAKANTFSRDGHNKSLRDYIAEKGFENLLLLLK